MLDKKLLTGMFAAVGASLCCITPVLAVLAGSTGMASTKEKHAIVSYDKTKTDIRTIMHAIGTTGYKPVGYDDADGHHSVEMKSDTHQLPQMIESSKCGGGKCRSN